MIEDPRGNTLNRGTQIILHLKEDSEEYLNEAELKRIVMTYSEFITFPIYLWMGKEVTKEVPMTEEEIQAANDKKDDEESEEIIMDDTEQVDMEEEEPGNQ